MKKLVIFDLDGTLLNTIADLAQATNQALEKLNFPTYPVDDYRFFVGNGINKLFERALPEGQKSLENVMKVRSLFIPYYNEHNADYSQPYPGICSLLKELNKKGLQIGVASNKYQEATEKLVHHYFPEIPFVSVLGQREGIPTKPDPTIVKDILGKTDLELKDVLYVGDSNVDMQTAQNAGVTAIGVSWGFRPKSELKEGSPLAIIDHAEELLDYID